MYMPGRLRTGSRPSRTVMSLAVYVVAMCSSGSVGERFGGDRSVRHHAHEFAALDHFAAFAAAARAIELVDLDAVLAAERGLEGERIVGEGRGLHADERV